MHGLTKGKCPQDAALNVQISQLACCQVKAFRASPATLLPLPAKCNVGMQGCPVASNLQGSHPGLGPRAEQGHCQAQERRRGLCSLGAQQMSSWSWRGVQPYLQGYPRAAKGLVCRWCLLRCRFSLKPGLCSVGALGVEDVQIGMHSPIAICSPGARRRCATVQHRACPHCDRRCRMRSQRSGC